MPLIRRLLVLLGVLVFGVAVLSACGGAKIETPVAVTQAPVPTSVPPSPVPPTPAPTQVPPAPAALITIKAIDPSAGMTYTDQDTKSPAALTTSGLKNVPVGVPQFLVASTKNLPKGVTASAYAWTLTPPDGSTATLDNATAEQISFTPDKVGDYKLGLVVTDSAGNKTQEADLTMSAGTWVGNGAYTDKPTAPQCAACHADKMKAWQATGHATMFSNGIDGKLGSHYSGACESCHTVGYNASVTANNGGFDDVARLLGWKFPAVLKDGNWAALDPKLQAVANIQCENCHGPGSQHSNNPQTGMDASLDSGVCEQCHNAPPHHNKGAQYNNSAHADASAMAFTYPIGPNHAECVRCHSGYGFASFLDNPTDNTKWKTDFQPVSCSTCHDPHDATNPYQLRVVNDTVGLPVDVKDVGLSATCMECHNNRTTVDQLLSAQSPTYPHYSSAVELVMGQDGFNFGQAVQNSPHGQIVGMSPMRTMDGTDLFANNIAGPCVGCHMYPTPGVDKDKNPLPGNNTVGEHTFAMVDAKGVENVAACQSCHNGITSFNFLAKADYDGDGKVDGVQDEVAGLLKLVYDAMIKSGIKDLGQYPYFGNVTTDVQKEAVYNYRLVYGVMGSKFGDGGMGRAATIHNFDRAVELLQLSYKALTGNDVPNATLIK